MAIAERLASWGSWGPRVADVRPRVQGAVIAPHDREYEQARTVWNGAIDRRPALVVRCADAADVACAVTFARAQGLPVAVRSGGHSLAGHSTCDGGAVIDLSLMKAIDIDPVRQIARIEPGLTWGEVAGEAQQYGLALTSGDTATVGVGGLTLGGGIGWMVRKYGLTIDNLRSVDLVTADGQAVTASAEENADLFWGLRGGGGNFGVATAFEYRLHAVGPTITGGMVIHPFAAASALLRFFREFCAGLSDDVMLNAALLHAPDDPSVKLAAVVLAHFGAAEEAEKELAPLLGFGSPLDVQVGPMPYTVLNSLLDDAFPSCALNYWKSSFLNGLHDEAIDAIVRDYASCPSPMTKFVIEHFHGAVARVEVEATAVPHREDGYDFLITSVWTDPASTDENIAWTRAAFHSVQPHASGRRYVNYLAADDTGTDPVRAAYGANYERLVALKTKYDPDNLFHLNFNISPRATVV